MFAKQMYKHVHANGCNFMTHYTLHTSVEAVGLLHWELAGVCQLPGFNNEPEELIGDKNKHWFIKVLTEHILCDRLFPTGRPYHGN